MKRCSWIIIGLLVGIAGAAQAASFDCGKARTTIEHSICANPVLSELDTELAEAFRIGKAYAGDKETYVRAQRHWMKVVRDACGSVDCLQKAYLARLDVLQHEPLPTQAELHSDNSEYFSVTCDREKGVLTVASLDSISELKKGRDVQQYIVNPQNLTTVSEEDGREYQQPGGNRYYHCWLRGARYEAIVTANIANANPQGECGATPPDITLSVKRNGAFIFSNTDFSACRAGPRGNYTIDQVAFSEPDKNIRVDANSQDTVLREIKRTYPVGALPEDWLEKFFGAQPTGNADTDLFLAVYARDIPAVQLALKHGANPNAKDDVGMPPLAELGTSQKLMPFGQDPVDFNARAEKVARLLLAAGASPNGNDGKGGTLLGALVGGDVPDTLIDLLLKHGADPGRGDVVVLAAQNGNVHLLRRFLDLGIDSNQVTGYGNSPLWVAAQSAASGFAPGSHATTNDYVNCVHLLLQHGAKLKKASGPMSVPEDLVRLFGSDDKRRNAKLKTVLKEMLPYMSHDELVQTEKRAERFPDLAGWLQAQMH